SFLRFCKNRDMLRIGVFLGIVEEFSAQISRLLDAGMRLSHIDSHHHVHTKPSLFPVMLILLSRFPIGSARLTRNIFDPGEIVSQSKRAKKSLWNSAVRNIGRAKTTTKFGTLAALMEHAAILGPTEIVEVMVHPGHPAYRKEEELLRSK